MTSIPELPAPASIGLALSRRHVPALDGLRGLAVSVVVWHNVVLSAEGIHYATLPEKLYVGLATAGWIGVTLFFALSGFLITGILRDEVGQPNAYLRFVRRRALRIFPLYYFTLFIMFIVAPVLHLLPDWLSEDHAHQFYYWTYLVNLSGPFGFGGPGFAHFWSLAVEEQFYLLWPFAALALTSRTLMGVCVGLAVTSLLARLALGFSGLPAQFVTDGLYSFTFCRWDALALGSALALAARTEQGRAWLARWSWPGVLGSLALLLLVVAWRHSLNPWDRGVEIAGYAIAAVLCAAIVSLAVLPGTREPGWITTFLCHPLLRTLGKYSYAIYVFHYPIMRATSQPWLSARVATSGTVAMITELTVASVLVMLAASALALVSWRFLEQPFVRRR